LVEFLDTKVCCVQLYGQTDADLGVIWLDWQLHQFPEMEQLEDEFQTALLERTQHVMSRRLNDDSDDLLLLYGEKSKPINL
jgi:hypothetical protein